MTTVDDALLREIVEAFDRRLHALEIREIGGGAVGNASLGADTTRFNHLLNGSLDSWRAGPGPFTVNGVNTADQWFMEDLNGTGTMSVSRDGTIKSPDSAYSAAIVYVRGTSIISRMRQNITSVAVQYSGRTVTFSAQVRATAGSAVRLRIATGAGNVFSSYHTGGSTFEALSISAVLPVPCTTFNVALELEANVTAHIDNAMLVLGPVAALYAPFAYPDVVVNERLGMDTARANLLTNGSFENWQRGTGPFTSGMYCADAWAVYAPGGTTSVSRNTANVDVGSLACAAVTTTSPGGTFGNGIYSVIDGPLEQPQLRGRTLSVSVRVLCSQASSVRAVLVGDKAATLPTLYQSAFHTGGGAYETLTVTFPLAAAATGMTVWVLGLVAGTWYVDNAMLVSGPVPADYAPLHQHEDLARCLRRYQRWGASIAGLSLGPVHTYALTNGIALIPLQARMGGTPVLAVSAAADWQHETPGLGNYVCATLGLAGVTGSTARIATTSATNGLAGQGHALLSAVNAASWLSLEWNP